MSKLDGWKTYISAIGLVGLAIYEFSVGNVDQGVAAILAALAAAGLRSAISKEAKAGEAEGNSER